RANPPRHPPCGPPGPPARRHWVVRRGRPGPPAGAGSTCPRAPHTEQDIAMTVDAATTGAPGARPRLRAHELVLLHGQPGSAADWQQVAGRLPAPLHAVAVDR